MSFSFLLFGATPRPREKICAAKKQGGHVRERAVRPEGDVYGIGAKGGDEATAREGGKGPEGRECEGREDLLSPPVC